MDKLNKRMLGVLFVLTAFACADVMCGEDKVGSSSSSGTPAEHQELLANVRASKAFTRDEQKKKVEASVLAASGNADKAAETLLGVSDEHMDSFAMTRLGQLQIKQGERGKGIATLNRAIERKPRIALPYVCLGDTYLTLGRYSEARACFTTAIQISPDQSAAYVGLLRIDRMTARRDMKDGPEYCMRVLAMEEETSQHYREAMDYLKWLMSDTAASSGAKP